MNAWSGNRAVSRKRMRLSKRTRRAVFVALVLSVALLGIFGILSVMRRVHFVSNPSYTLRHLIIETGDSVSEESVREWTGIHENMNLFAVDIGRTRREFVKVAPHVRHLEIRRLLPDTLHIRVIERQPIARIGRRGMLATDEEGLVFVYRGGLEMLPAIVGEPVGVDPRQEGGGVLGLQPGDRLIGNGLAAIQALRAIDEMRLGLPIEEVDVSPPDYIVIRLDAPLNIFLAWEGMGRGSAHGRRNLHSRLRSVIETLSDPGFQGAGYTVDATIDDSHVYVR